MSSTAPVWMFLWCMALLGTSACGRLNFDLEPAADEDGGLVDASSDIDAGELGLDMSFGESGVLVLDVGGVDNLNFSTNGIAVQQDGRILLSGTGGSVANGDAIVVRLLDDGALDPSFGIGGIASVDYGNADLGQGMALQSDGRILLAISAKNSGAPTDSAVARLLADGSLDASFGNVGISEVDFPSASDSSNGVFVAADGKIVFGGQGCCGTTGWDLVNVRLQPDGTSDTGFGDAGQVVTDILGDDEFGSPIAVLDDGSIYAVGSGYASAQDSFDFVVLRLLADGSPDPAFGGSGAVTADFGSQTDRARDLVVYADGRVLVVGHTSEGMVSADFALIRLDASGALDQSFGIGGKATFDLGGSDILRAVLLLPDGRIVAAGSTTRGADTNFVVLVMNSDGNPDTSFASDGVVELDLVPGQDDEAWGVALDGAGRLLVFGETTDDTQGDFALVRLTP